MAPANPALPALCWLLVLIGGSAIYRKMRRKPVLFFGVKDADFQERTASGSSADTWWRMLGGARNCLVVAIVHGRLTIRPWFPFNLMFLPELYGLEVDVPLASVESVQADRFLFRRRIRLVLRTASGRSQPLWLFLKRPDEFMHVMAIGAERAPVADSPTNR